MKYSKDEVFNFQIWKLMICMRIEGASIKDLSNYLDSEILRGNEKEIVMNLLFNLSKGKEYAVREINAYLYTTGLLEIEENTILIEDLIIGFLKDKYENNEINIIEFGRIVYKLALIYHPESELISAGDLEFLPSQHKSINLKIMKRAKYL